MANKLLRILGLDEMPAVAELKVHYRKKLSELHPDHGGDYKDFLELVREYKNFEYTCPTCSGTGFIDLKIGPGVRRDRCTICLGKGTIKVAKPLQRMK